MLSLSSMKGLMCMLTSAQFIPIPAALGSHTCLPNVSVMRCLDHTFHAPAVSAHACSLKLEEMSGLKLKPLGLVQTVCGLLAYVHVVACIWYSLSLASLEEYDTAWISSYQDGFAADEDTPRLHKYMASALWAIGMVTGLNSPVNPENHAERTFSITVYVVSSLFFAFTIAIVQTQLNDIVNDRFNRKMEQVLLHTRKRRLRIALMQTRPCDAAWRVLRQRTNAWDG